MECRLTAHADSGRLSDIQTTVGKTILEALQQTQHTINAPCGGRGTCKKCKIRAQGMLSAPTDDEQNALTPAELQGGYRMACMATLQGDAEIWLEAENQQILLKGNEPIVSQADPVFAAREISIVQPSLSNQSSDQGRHNLANASLSTLRKLPSVLSSENSSFWVVENTKTGQIVDVSTEKPRLLAAAIDIGTTTIAMYLLNMQSGEVLSVQSAMNPQRAFGADVISRIDYAKQPDGLRTLQTAIASKINDLIAQAAADSAAKPEDIRLVCCVGNTVMLHLLLGIPPENIAAAPFVPVFVDNQSLPASQIGIALESAVLYTGPCVAGYIGADTTSAILSCDMHKSNDIALLIDIGTNGEIALGNAEGIVCCSAAAGPAFEGAHISCGSGAVAGAISQVRLTADGGVELATIGGKPPKSICGSGLIDAIAEMLREGILDETGRIDEDEMPDRWSDRVFERDNALAFALTENRSVYISQRDVREVQLAKGAIAAGIQILMNASRCNYSSIRKLYLAGGFGSFINVHNACRIGLLPQELEGLATSVGNAAGMGAERVALSQTATGEVEKLAKRMHYIELSSQTSFTSLFAESMLFPEEI